MKHRSLGFGLSSKRTRRRVFLDEMVLVVPWADLVGLVDIYRVNQRRRLSGKIRRWT